MSVSSTIRTLWMNGKSSRCYDSYSVVWSIYSEPLARDPCRIKSNWEMRTKNMALFIEKSQQGIHHDAARVTSRAGLHSGDRTDGTERAGKEGPLSCLSQVQRHLAVRESYWKVSTSAT